MGPGVWRVTMTPIAMDISVNTNPLCGLTSAEQRLQAALVDVSALQAELDRTYQALEGIGRESTALQACEPGYRRAQLDDVRFQLSELVAIGAERRALQQDATVLVAQMDALQEQHLKMQQRMAAMRRQWFAGKASDGTADTEEQLFELQLRMATLRGQWVPREITSAVAPGASQDGQRDEAELTSIAPPEAVACLA